MPDLVSQGEGVALVDGPRAAGPYVEELDVTAVAIVMGASANRVWTPAHVDPDAATAAGIADMFLDTSTQLGLLSGVAERAAGTDARPGRLALRMRQPVLRGHRLRLEATVDPAGPERDTAGVGWISVAVRALVDGVVHSTLDARVAVDTADGTDPWSLGPDRWHP